MQEAFSCGNCTWYVDGGLLTLQGGNACGDGCNSINLHDQNISAIHPDAFNFNASLVVSLNLNSNNLGSLAVGVFGSLTSLQKLELNNNNLQDLPLDIFIGNPHLTYLDLGSNRRNFTDASTGAIKSLMLKPIPTVAVAPGIFYPHRILMPPFSCQIDLLPQFTELVSARVGGETSGSIYEELTFVGSARNWTFVTTTGWSTLAPCTPCPTACPAGQFEWRDSAGPCPMACMPCSTDTTTCKYEIRPCSLRSDRICSSTPPLWRMQDPVC